MREIKFRAWHKTLLIMITDQKEFKIVSPYGTYLYDYLNNSDYKFMQFTGLVDINGKEIYEGDILSPKNYNGVFCQFNNYIEFDIGMFHFNLHQELKPLHASLSISINNNNPYIVIGNIYENPELLNV